MYGSGAWRTRYDKNVHTSIIIKLFLRGKRKCLHTKTTAQAISSVESQFMQHKEKGSFRIYDELADKITEDS